MTRRGRVEGGDIPIMGCPPRRRPTARLSGKARVAICEQTEDPAAAKKRGAKAVVQREVVRIVTPHADRGQLLDGHSHNFLMALAAVGDDSAAWVDMSTAFQQAVTRRPSPACWRASAARYCPEAVEKSADLATAKRLADIRPARRPFRR